MRTVTLPFPDDWHVHLRDGAMMQAVTPYTARDFRRALIMPNLVPPITTAHMARDYRKRIMEAARGYAFEPKMTLYLTEASDGNEIAEAYQSGLIAAVKLYPAGATTNSAAGVRDIGKVMPILEQMAKVGCPLCCHGEVTHEEVDIFDREAAFIDTVLDPLRRALPELKVTMEHITTLDAVAYVRESQANLSASITTHHLVINRNHILVGGIKPHYYCLPIAKRESHRLALRQAAISGDKRFFLGTDTAPHLAKDKLSPCGCAGCFTALNTMPLLAHIFDEENALDRLAGFTSEFGAAHYGFDVNKDIMTLENLPFEGPSDIETAHGPVHVFDPGFQINWRVQRKEA